MDFMTLCQSIINDLSGVWEAIETVLGGPSRWNGRRTVRSGLMGGFLRGLCYPTMQFIIDELQRRVVRDREFRLHFLYALGTVRANMVRFVECDQASQDLIKWIAGAALLGLGGIEFAPGDLRALFGMAVTMTCTLREFQVDENGHGRRVRAAAFRADSAAIPARRNRLAVQQVAVLMWLCENPRVLIEFARGNLENRESASHGSICRAVEAWMAPFATNKDVRSGFEVLLRDQVTRSRFLVSVRELMWPAMVSYRAVAPIIKFMNRR